MSIVGMPERCRYIGSCEEIKGTERDREKILQVQDHLCNSNFEYCRIYQSNKQRESECSGLIKII